MATVRERRRCRHDRRHLPQHPRVAIREGRIIVTSSSELPWSRLSRFPYRLSSWYLLTRTFLFINKRLYRDVVSRFGPRLTGTILDIGCGESLYRPLFTNATAYFGVDVAGDRHPDVVAWADRLPIASGSVDSIVCMEVLEHVPDERAVVREAARVLRPGGTAFITVPMSWNLHYEPYDFRRFTRYGLEKLLEDHGFEVLEITRIGGLFALVGSRLVDGIGSEAFRRLGFVPAPLRHLAILAYTVPTSLLFWTLSRLLDDLGRTDAMAWAVLAHRPGPHA